MAKFAHMDSGIKKGIRYSLSVMLMVVLVYYAFRGIEWRSFWEGLLQTDWVWVCLALVAGLAAVVIRALRWKEILHPLDSDISLSAIWNASNLGNAASVAIPGSGEILRCGMVATDKSGYDKTFGTIILERMWDMLAIAVLMILAILGKKDEFGPFFRDNIWGPLADGFSFSLWWIVSVLVVIAVLFVFASLHYADRSRFWGKSASLIRGVLQGLDSFRHMPGKALFAAYTVALWLMYILMSYFVLKSIPVFSGLDVWDALFVSALGNIASIIPVPGGIGAYHYLLALTLSTLYGASWEQGLLFATVAHESHAVLILVLGLVSWIDRTFSKSKS